MANQETLQPRSVASKGFVQQQHKRRPNCFCTRVNVSQFCQNKNRKQVQKRSRKLHTISCNFWPDLAPFSSRPPSAKIRPKHRDRLCAIPNNFLNLNLKFVSTKLRTSHPAQKRSSRQHNSATQQSIQKDAIKFSSAASTIQRSCKEISHLTKNGWELPFIAHELITNSSLHKPKFYGVEWDTVRSAAPCDRTYISRAETNSASPTVSRENSGVPLPRDQTPVQIVNKGDSLHDDDGDKVSTVAHVEPCSQNEVHVMDAQYNRPIL